MYINTLKSCVLYNTRLSMHCCIQSIVALLVRTLDADRKARAGR